MNQDNVETSSAADDDYLLMKRRSQVGEPAMGLNLTAMMDMLTIILVYLVKIYGDMPANAADLKDLTIAQTAVSERKALDAKGTLVVLTKDIVMVGGTPVAGCASPIDITPPNSKDPNSGSACARALATRFDETYNTAKTVSGKNFNEAVEVVVDAGLPYQHVVNLLSVAGKAKYNKCKLVTKLAAGSSAPKVAP